MTAQVIGITAVVFFASGAVVIFFDLDVLPKPDKMPRPVQIVVGLWMMAGLFVAMPFLWLHMKIEEWRKPKG